MRNLQLTLAVADEQYIEPFLLYARTGEFAKRVSVRAFSKVEAFLAAMKEDRPDFVLGESAFLRPWLEDESGRGVPWAALGGGEESLALGGPVLLPFQPLNLLLTAVMDLVGAVQTAGGRSASEAEVIAVYSAAAGAGKTTLAMNLVKQLGSRGHRVFYLNLETIDSSAAFRSGSGGHKGHDSGLPELLYELRAARENGEICQTPLSRYAPFQETIKCLSFPPLDRPDELLQMDERDTEELIHYIASSGVCDVIVADTDTESHERSHALLRRADRVLWLLVDELLHLRKTSGWMEHWENRQPAGFYELLGKSLFVLNRYGGRIENRLPRPEIRPFAFLSYIPSWKYLSREDVLLGSPIFQRDILALCEQLGLSERSIRPASVQESARAASVSL